MYNIYTSPKLGDKGSENNRQEENRHDKKRRNGW